MAVLQGRTFSVEVDGRGRISGLSLNGERNVILTPTGLFRGVLKTGDNWEDVVECDQQDVQVAAGEKCITVRAEQLKTRSGVKNIAVELKISLEGDEKLRFDATIQNRSDSMVNDWIWPRLGEIRELEGGPVDLLFPKHLGERIEDVCEYLKKLSTRESAHELSLSYPGPLSMQWMMLQDGGTCLYLSGRDDLFYTSALRVKGSASGGVTMEMNKLAFVKPGEDWQCPPYIAWLYEGDWMQGARDYAAWAAAWRKPVKPREWIRRMNGYFLVINKQQYGDELWPYDTLPELYDIAQAHGFDTLGLFGWYHSGHDNQYPDLEVSPTMGGEETLRSNIRKVQEKGGHVTLYFQGHLMDTGTDYYRKTGCHLEGKTRWGTPYYEYYDKYCSSDFLHHFSRKPFATVCPSCAQWHELMAQRADWIHSLGADGILYDQIGGMPPYPCFAEDHRHLHGKPSLSHAPGRIRLHQRIRKQADQYENFAYLTEHVTDVHSQFLDCLHGIGSFPGAQGSGAAMNGMGIHDVKSSGTAGVGPVMMPEMFRYTFPDTLITIRNPNPFVSKRYANYALFYGYKLEMELRYLTDQEFIRQNQGKAEREYVRKICDFRDKLRDYLLEGRFMAQEGLSNRNPAIKAAVFRRADGKRAAALWNDTGAKQAVDLSVEGVSFNAWASPEGVGGEIPKTLEAGEVLVLYTK